MVGNVAVDVKPLRGMEWHGTCFPPYDRRWFHEKPEPLYFQYLRY